MNTSQMRAVILAARQYEKERSEGLDHQICNIMLSADLFDRLVKDLELKPTCRSPKAMLFDGIMVERSADMDRESYLVKYITFADTKFPNLGHYSE